MQASPKFLNSVELFHGLVETDIEKLIGIAGEFTAQRNDVIVKEGDAGDALFILGAGSAIVMKGMEGERKEVLSILEAGAFFGEMALIDKAPRSASVVALEESSLIKIPGEKFIHLLEETPDLSSKVYRNFARAMSRRLRDVSSKLHNVATDAEKIKTNVDNLCSEVISVVSHEMRTPIAVIQGSAETLVDVPLDAERQRKLLTNIGQHTKRLTRLFDDIAQLAELQFRGASLNKTTCDLHGLAREICDALAEHAKTRSVIFELSFPKGAHTVKADEKKLRKALFHIIENGIKFNREGGKLFLSSDKDTAAVWLTVKDEGIGMCTDDICNLKQTFAQKKGSMDQARVAGMGLGIPLADSIIKLHGGTLEFESPEGGGVVVKITLPLSG